MTKKGGGSQTFMLWKKGGHHSFYLLVIHWVTKAFKIYPIKGQSFWLII